MFWAGLSLAIVRLLVTISVGTPVWSAGPILFVAAPIDLLPFRASVVAGPDVVLVTMSARFPTATTIRELRENKVYDS